MQISFSIGKIPANRKKTPKKIQDNSTKQTNNDSTLKNKEKGTPTTSSSRNTSNNGIFSSTNSFDNQGNNSFPFNNQSSTPNNGNFVNFNNNQPSPNTNFVNFNSSVPNNGNFVNFNNNQSFPNFNSNQGNNLFPFAQQGKSLSTNSIPFPTINLNSFQLNSIWNLPTNLGTMSISSFPESFANDDINHFSAKEIGIGASSSISKTTLSNGENVVIKKFNSASGDDILGVIEIDIMARFRHPNLMHLKSLKTSKEFRGVNYYIDRLMIIMDLMDYDLGSNGAKYSNDIIFEILYNASRGLEFLHKNNILHLDIKPQNFLIKYEHGKFVTKLTDMGLSSSVNPKIKYYFKPDDTKNNSKEMLPIPDNFLIKNLTRESISLPYRPIEVFRDNIVSDRSDVWSLGITFLEILSGKNILLFMGDNSIDILSSVNLLKEDQNRMNFVSNLLLGNKIRCLDNKWVILINSMLNYDFLKRIPCSKVSGFELFDKYRTTASTIISQADYNNSVNTANNVNNVNNVNTANTNTNTTNSNNVTEIITSEIITKNYYSPELVVLTGILIIIKYAHRWDLLIETVFLGIDFFYRTLKKYKAEHNAYNIHLLAYNCIFIAMKMLEDINKIISTESLSQITGKYSVKQLIDMETAIIIKHGGMVYLPNIFHLCNCRCDLINGLNLLSNIFMYPIDNYFESEISDSKHICTTSSNKTEYPILINEIITESIFVKNGQIIAESDCVKLYEELKK